MTNDEESDVLNVIPSQMCKQTTAAIRNNSELSETTTTFRKLLIYTHLQKY